MANPAPLASARTFDDRLKSADEARWLAIRYAPTALRERMCALYCLNLECQRALRLSEPMLGRIRIQWWRETILAVAAGAAARRHDLAEELARVGAGRQDLADAIGALLDAYDAVLDDHARSGGHTNGPEHEARHLAIGARLSFLAGLALCPSAVEFRAELEEIGTAELLLRAGSADAAERWRLARRAARRTPSRLWPAIAHLAAGGRGPLGARFAILRTMLLMRL